MVTNWLLNQLPPPKKNVSILRVSYQKNKLNSQIPDKHVVFPAFFFVNKRGETNTTSMHHRGSF